ncbi:cyclic pyranopterin monophosphate synthase MoaC [Methanobacterium spitsbergense]|uniref:Probable cyclic pyranopterin monophosphate synthase n=1 Tax=Methanobacterium spitsbergense TaxID=2874285 RepID=A0A8T5V2F6_9EURY|nr:cyclic pyranopterin monophosphate synthase MoaC [Methanobacterium spitsbergense]MBZ2165855.1 cyclic pyranopterin monophosphate synthase MoaC [Methanobacterium spitsbergense]
MAKEFTHLSNTGVKMVEVGNKAVVKRTATAKGKIHLQKFTIDLIKREEIKKGNVLTTAQIAAISAVKSTHHLIPLCHSLTITGVDVDFEFGDDFIETNVIVRCNGKTGVEMEALTGVSVALLTVWDMVKSVEKDENGQYPSTRISDIVVSEKRKE